MLRIETNACSWCARDRRVATKGREAICAECAGVLREACATRMWPKHAMDLFEIQERIGRDRRARHEPFGMAWLQDRLVEATEVALKTTGKASSPEVERLQAELVQRLKAGEPSPGCAICGRSPPVGNMTLGAALIACGPCLAEACEALATPGTAPTP